eukprot:454831_1
MAALKLREITMNEERFLSLLGNLIGQARTLQNDPSQGLIPREDNVGDFILETLQPFSKEEGGPLIVERVHFTPGRGNIIIKYPGQGHETVSFVGSHMDVVPANPEEWTVDPFKLTRDSNDSDILYGRGTTDCLGHVALLTDLFCSLAKLQPKLQRSVIAVFIVNEENGIVEGIGVDRLDECGKLDEIGIKNGPVIWVDAADTGVCVGSAGVIQWSLEARGKMFHSGFPDKAINPIELVSEAVAKQNANNAISKQRNGEAKQIKRKIEQLDLDGNVLKIWDKAILIQRSLGYQSSAIFSACYGKKKTAYGYKWRFLE